MTLPHRIRWFDRIGWVAVPWCHSCQHTWACAEGPVCVLAAEARLRLGGM